MNNPQVHIVYAAVVDKATLSEYLVSKCMPQQALLQQ